MGIVCSGVVVVTMQCSHSVINSLAQLQAMEVADEQMQQLLAKASVKEGIEYGRSDRYPDIQWQRKVEVFDEPLTGTTWVRAVCSATYTDANGQPQVMELTSWLTRLNDQQLALLRQGQQLFDSIEDAAMYAQVSVETLRQWIENGMVTTEDGAFIKENLDLYKRTGGNPTDSEKAQQVRIPLSLRPDRPEQIGQPDARPR